MRFYFALLAVAVSLCGTDGRGVSFGVGLGNSFNGSSPSNFLSGLGTCLYSPAISCTGKTEYRTIDGSCNHATAPYIGKSETPYIRAKPALYIDGRTPRTKSYFGKVLPTPRHVTLNYFINKDSSGAPIDDPESAKFNNILAVFARFIEHDLYQTKSLEGTTCCPLPSTAGVCTSIILEATDPFFSPFQRTCLPKSNIASSPKLDCTATISQQVNLNTHFLDLSNVYGSTDAKSRELRQLTDGLLKVTVNLEKTLLPTPATAIPDCPRCFLAGDSRVNIDPLLMTMYTLWVRLHNDIAKQIKSIQPTYVDEKIFQEARKIVIGIYQHIVYNEFLPTLHSTTALKTGATTTTKVDATKPQIANYFGIAFTALADTITSRTFLTGATSADTVNLKESWYKSDKLWEANGIKELSEGMLKAKAGKYDRFMPKALYDQYLQRALGQGTDKAALNFQQSRENGINTYYVMTATRLSKYDMTAYTDLTALEAVASTEIQKMYRYIYDIEFLPGLLGETATAPAVLGPLMVDIIENQFKNLRDGDAFHYNHAGVFSAAELAEIKKMTMSAILCKYGEMTNSLTDVFIPEAAGTNDPAVCTAVLEKSKVLNVCVWATGGWSDWTSTPCMGGIKIETRQCQYGPESTCECEGLPVVIKSCPPGLQLLLSQETKEKVEREFFSSFDLNGHALPGVSRTPEQVAEDILKHVLSK